MGSNKKLINSPKRSHSMRRLIEEDEEDVKSVGSVGSDGSETTLHTDGYGRSTGSGERLIEKSRSRRQQIGRASLFKTQNNTPDASDWSSSDSEEEPSYNH